MINDHVYDVKVENAVKSYDGKTRVLKGFNMNVASGSMWVTFYNVTIAK